MLLIQLAAQRWKLRLLGIVPKVCHKHRPVYCNLQCVLGLGLISEFRFAQPLDGKKLVSGLQAPYSPKKWIPVVRGRPWQLYVRRARVLSARRMFAVERRSHLPNFMLECAEEIT